MKGLILRGPEARRRPALEIVTSLRLPKMGKRHGPGAFDAEGDVTVDCAVEDCGWHAYGPRSEMVKAVSDHRRRFHSQAEEAIVTRLNTPHG